MRYSAKLLFQFRVVKNGRENRRRICEERIICFVAESAARALEIAKERGMESEASYDHHGKHISFEFIGVVELIDLGSEADPDEVWSRLCEIVSPMERRTQLIPAENELSAFKSPSTRKRGRLTI